MFTLAIRALANRPCAFVIVALAALPCCAQTTKIAWKEAIKLIDSDSPADVLAASTMLKQSVKPGEPMPPAGWLSQAVYQLRSHDLSGAEKTLADLDRQFAPGKLGALTGLRLRAKLCAALIKDDATAATAAFKDLVRYVVRGEGDQLDMRAAAHTIGITVGMLNVDQAGSLISQQVLKIGADCMASSKIRGVNFAYESALAQAHEQTAAIVSHLDFIKQNGMDDLKAEYVRRLDSLRARQAEVEQQKLLNGEVARNSREQTSQNKVDLRQVSRDIVRFNNELNRPTPGHPGLKVPPPPPPPPRSAIPVREYDTRTEYHYETRNGEQVRVPYTVEERRPQSEIDRERERRHSELVSQYSIAMANYRIYETNYDTQLKTWTQNDLTRRKDLSERKAQAEADRDNLMQANKAIESEKKDFAKELREKRTAEEQEDFELRMMNIALEASAAGKPQSAFRPTNFNLLNLSQEKILLQR